MRRVEPNRIIERGLVTVVLLLGVLLIVAEVISVGKFFSILAMFFDILRRVFEELSRMFP
ncbi:MAG: hypothetical protein JSW01_02015 [Candidatus Bathyarchaeota archaeon]|nr:MAG: hypothetical protein JSW01_02015 [Candidatus Bathyarchaeota archaeon]